MLLEYKKGLPVFCFQPQKPGLVEPPGPVFRGEGPCGLREV